MVKLNINKELEEELLSLVKNREKKIPWNKSKELDKFIDSSLSENTAHGYTYDWKEFVTWCEVNKKPSLPASYDTIGEYLKHLSKISSPQTKQPLHLNGQTHQSTSGPLRCTTLRTPRTSRAGPGRRCTASNLTLTYLGSLALLAARLL